MPPRRTLLAIATLLRRGLSSGVGGVGAVVDSKLTLDNINPAVLVTQYAVRGELVQRASAIQESNFAEKPYRKLLECNIGNPQAVGQSPLTFNRQVLSLLCYPELARNPAAAALFEPDAILRAKEYLQAIPNGLGAYSESQGFAIVRQQVANFITKRDAGVPAYKENIFLTDGASKGVEKMLSLILRGRTDGVLVPIPQYPLYSATLALAEAHLLGYELVEEEGWRLSVDVLEEKLAAAKANGIHTRGLVVINPGNPTGNSLPLENMKEVLRFCGKHGLILMADEVYQENVWLESRPFHSFKKVLHTMADAPKVQLVSFHSTSKGFLGECGMRGGYFELCNFDPEVLPPNTALRPPAPHALFAQHSAYCPIGALRPNSPPPHARSPTHTPPTRHPHATLGSSPNTAPPHATLGYAPNRAQVVQQLLKLVSIGLCSNTLGQIATGLMVQPPALGEPSYARYSAEKEAILTSMRRRALKLVDGLNAMEGVTCNAPEGAMYAFPSITLPPKAIAAAEAAGKVPDTFYALALLEATGIVVVPGSGFGQKQGTWHFRTTFLPPEKDMEGVITRMGEFHKGFMAKYS